MAIRQSNGDLQRELSVFAGLQYVSSEHLTYNNDEPDAYENIKKRNADVLLDVGIKVALYASNRAFDEQFLSTF